MARRRLMSMTEYARHRGVTTSAISQALARGRLSEWSCQWDARRGCYRIDVTRADDEWHRRTFEGWGGRR